MVGSASTPSLGNAFMGCLKRATLQVRCACCGAPGVVCCARCEARRFLLCWGMQERYVAGKGTRQGRCEKEELWAVAGVQALSLARPLHPRGFSCSTQGGLKTQKFEILKNMHGVLRPGSITLLLGPPGVARGAGSSLCSLCRQASLSVTA